MPLADRLVDDPVAVGTLTERFAVLRNQAMSEHDSMDFIRGWA
ncbi:MAG TPA: hypothetical protein VGX25_16170 [Actinophytocola sp.]|nr:hypothetical protein [Actinophytocola sp.]HEV2780920.1 hypothetical protein [Actinophytocola sp.]